jgi:flagellin
MALIINHNMMAANAARNLGTVFDRLSTSTQRLSSGLRINSAADDAAGLAVRELQRAEIAVLNQGMRNAGDAISMIQTAEGAMQVIDEKLIRMKELAEQAATGTYTNQQRQIMQDEYDAMADEITRIAVATDFNGQKLLDGSMDGTGMKIHFGTGNDSAEDYFYISIGTFTAESMGVAVGNASQASVASGASVASQAAVASRAATSGTSYASVASQAAVASQASIASQAAVASQASTASRTGIASQASVASQAAVASRAAVASQASQASVASRASGATGASVASQAAVASAASAASQASVAGWGVTLNTQDGAQQTLTVINAAINAKDRGRAGLGAIQNRLENTITNLSIQAEMTQVAESRISDVDVATEMTEFMRNSIMAQAATAMLAQANGITQLALTLLG